MDLRGLQIARWHSLIVDRVHSISQRNMLASYGVAHDDPRLRVWQTELAARALPEFAAAARVALPHILALAPSLGAPAPCFSSSEFTLRDGSVVVTIDDPVVSRFSLAADYDGESSPWDRVDDREWVAALDETRLLQVTAGEAHRLATWLLGAAGMPAFVQTFDKPAVRLNGALQACVFNIVHEAASPQRAILDRWGVTCNADNELRKLSLLDAVSAVFAGE
jgi:hypothetical protein